MYFTKNKTSATWGLCHATVIAYSAWTDGEGVEHPIVTWELMYPRYIHSELMTHRAFSRNAGSSRATPLSVTTQEVLENPAFFTSVGRNKPGMVAAEELSDAEKVEFKKEWEELAAHVVGKVTEWHNKFGIHKQVLNRALEPFMYIRTIVTATDVDNFFKLRLAHDAQPEMRDLARAMQDSLFSAEMAFDGEYAFASHVPYTQLGEEGGVELSTTDIIRSVAACARVSYLKHNGKPSTLKEDEELVDRLLRSGHMTPFEHVAVSINQRDRNFSHWYSLRSILEDYEDELRAKQMNIHGAIAHVLVRSGCATELDVEAVGDTCGRA